jgi:hypothetical protein
MRLRTNQLYFAVALLVSPLFQPISAQGRSTVDDYASRLAKAEQRVNEALELDGSASELAPIMNEVKRLLPASEEVEFKGAIISIDNAWLHESVNNIMKNTEGDAKRRLSTLDEISARLAGLLQSVKAGQTAEDAALQDRRAKLDEILARPEYQPEKKRESMMMRWGRQVLELIGYILRQLAKLLIGSPRAQAPVGGGGLVAILRALISLAVIAALIFGAVKLARLFRTRRKPAKEAEPREALGEEIAEDATSADLFATASELARQGEYRKAIRRAYIALLCEFDQRGKLRLERSKTNRDYLGELRSEQRIYPTFSVMTLAFERAWYGQERATEEQFQSFVTLYQEAIK